MPDGLTYPSLICVLEHLDPNKRIHITARSPSLTAVKASIPFHLDYLCLQENYLEINRVSYQINEITQEYDGSSARPENEQLMEGELRVGPDMTTFLERVVEFDGEIHSVQVPVNVPKHMAIRKLMAAYLHGEIRVKNLEIEMNGEGILRLPANLRIYPRKLTTVNDDFRNFLKIIHPTCLPLQQLTTRVLDDGFWNCPHIKSVKKLKLFKEYEKSIEWVQMENGTFNHPNVVLINFRMNPELLFTVIEDWLEKGRNHGTKLKIEGLRGFELNNLRVFYYTQIYRNYVIRRGKNRDGCDSIYISNPTKNRTDEIFVELFDKPGNEMDIYMEMQAIPTINTLETMPVVIWRRVYKFFNGDHHRMFCRVLAFVFCWFLYNLF